MYTGPSKIFSAWGEFPPFVTRYVASATTTIDNTTENASTSGWIEPQSRCPTPTAQMNS